MNTVIIGIELQIALTKKKYIKIYKYLNTKQIL